MWSALVATVATIAAVAADEAHAQEATSIVQDGKWRFTAVTDRLIRIEYDEEQQFVDEQTMAFFRSAPTGKWQVVATDDSWKVMNTSSVCVRYQLGPPRVGSVTVSSRSDAAYTWAWGDDPEVGNLRGAARTLDSYVATLDLNCHNQVSTAFDNSEMHCSWGLVSRRGWAVVNDTGMPLWKDGWYVPSRNSTDISVFLHGLDFTGALRDFFYASGPPALPPRYAFGTMFTRWFNFDSDSVMSLVDDFEARSMPLDVWVFDMNWHKFGPWGSYTWNVNSYPRVQRLLDWFQSRGLRVGANTHDHSGFTAAEKLYGEICSVLRCSQGQDIPFDLYNKTYVNVQEEVWRTLSTHGDQQGFDFAWIDYQQGESNVFEDTLIPNINPTIVLNMLRFTDPEAWGENIRPMILSRWGGMGNHRYPLGFSGDQLHSWEGLAFLPYFTSTGANVAFNYWSHDTVGGNHTDYELHVRWAQMTAWSPVFRIHDKGEGTGPCSRDDHCTQVVPWDLPNPFFTAIRAAAQLRDQLVPYIYTASWASASSGQALVRPMYYENPLDDRLYGLDGQYLFGPDMVISPITASSGPNATGFQQALGAVEWTVYAPASPGGWVDYVNGNFYFDEDATDVYGINDVPGLVRQGAVIPMRPRFRGESSLSRAGQPLSTLEFRIMPAKSFYRGGSTNGSVMVVDDDGLSKDYLKGQQTTTRCEYNFTDRSFKIKLSQVGSFPGRPANVTLRLSFPQLPPVIVESTTGLGDIASDYDRSLLGTVLTVRDVDLAKGPSIKVMIDPAYSSAVLPNFVGVLGRLRRARYVKDALDMTNIPYGQERADLTDYVLAASQMTPGFAATLPALWSSATAQVQAVLRTDKDLQVDPRRSSFVASMLDVAHAAGPHVPYSPAARAPASAQTAVYK